MSEKNGTDEIQQRWEGIYREVPLEELPWDEGKPSAELVALIQSGVVEKGAALDICCGSGNNAIYLAQQGFTCYGIDISPTALNYARQKADREGLSCNLTPGDATQLPYPDNSFTLVFDRGCFHSMSPQERQTYIQGIHRVLKPGGKYQLLCFSSRDRKSYQPPHSFSPQEIRHHFSALFRIHHIKEFSRKVESTRHYFLSALMEKKGTISGNTISGSLIDQCPIVSPSGTVPQMQPVTGTFIGNKSESP